MSLIPLLSFGRRLRTRLAWVVSAAVVALFALTLALLAYQSRASAEVRLQRDAAQALARAVAVMEALPWSERPMAAQYWEFAPLIVAPAAPPPRARPLPLPPVWHETLANFFSLEDLSFWEIETEAGSRRGATVILEDGTPLSALLPPQLHRPQPNLPWRIVTALALAGIGTWLITLWALRRVTSPLERLIGALETFATPQASATPLPEHGPYEVVLTARTLNALRERIEQLLAARTALLAGIAHDLRTPLARIRLRVEVLPEDEIRNGIERDLADMQKLIDLSLDYARSLTPHLEYQEVDLNEFVTDLVALYRESGVEIETILPAPPLSATVDPAALGRILSNLLDNASRYGTRVRLTLRPSAERTCEFTIEDDGPGIPRESRRAVLEPFVRLDPSRNYDTGGTGLGLAIAVNLARAMNGTLVLEDSALGGLCARLMLPCEPATGCGGGHGSL
ncbi:sensor histidine kinase [Tepidiphilus baoligensis]|uniref:histidine kinase n=1 Tax=Tepidiphilus baoligensis TaxID=2698687 RepID=A0ABX1QMS8_9PROT|nr:ATP-binding protein [Tepidiphilus baoligensis]NMH17272.1 HAMP domain-containing protein [Tepidiphilus baoligensis]